jgi:hypothetical protein
VPPPAPGVVVAAAVPAAAFLPFAPAGVRLAAFAHSNWPSPALAAVLGLAYAAGSPAKGPRGAPVAGLHPPSIIAGSAAKNRLRTVRRTRDVSKRRLILRSGEGSEGLAGSGLLLSAI